MTPTDLFKKHEQSARSTRNLIDRSHLPRMIRESLAITVDKCGEQRILLRPHTMSIPRKSHITWTPTNNSQQQIATCSTKLPPPLVRSCSALSLPSCCWRSRSCCWRGRCLGAWWCDVDGEGGEQEMAWFLTKEAVSKGKHALRFQSG